MLDSIIAPLIMAYVKDLVSLVLKRESVLGKVDGGFSNPLFQWDWSSPNAKCRSSTLLPQIEVSRCGQANYAPPWDEWEFLLPPA